MTRAALLLLVFPGLLHASPLPHAVPLRNAGFEEPGAGPVPAGWSLRSSTGEPAVVRAARDAHTGGTSLEIGHQGDASTTVESDPVRLIVGRPYVVSAWVKTGNVRSDPGARYPTAVPATLSMASFPFTNHATALGATQDWTRLEATFFATQEEDRIRLHLGYNGTATGTARFDDVRLEEIDDIRRMIPLETVRWYGPAFRYNDRGWIFVHIEGDAYTRGVQYGHLLAQEIIAYIEKLGVMRNESNPEDGWNTLRTLTDAMMLRGFREEYLIEMRGIAEGAAEAGASVYRRPVNFLDVVTLNSAIDIGQIPEALGNTAHPLSGRSFRPDGEETSIPERLHKCSSFLANGPATADGKIVFGQIFMWRGYTGVHWNVICDVVPAEGHRLVYQTFPGGIHSGSDFYINDAGIMLGETTVMQTPFNPRGTPQASRIREAAQYASSVDDVVRILTAGNNGLYTNDWLIGDTKGSEIAILLLGTARHRLWRSSANDWPGNTTGFYWSVNNAKDPGVRMEYIPDPADAPFDIVFGPVNRDVAFLDFYRTEKGSIDAPAAARVLASSPVNRPHACDGKVTTSAMASELVFLAHYGKTTQREKFPEKHYRLMPDLPGAIPHLTLGYAAFSPRLVTERLQALRPAHRERPDTLLSPPEVSALGEALVFPKKLLWSNTVLPAAERDNWFVSASAAYHRLLDGLPAAPRAAAEYFRDQLADLDCRLAYTVAREGPLAPKDAARLYDRYGHYQIPRTRGIYALHQLRLDLGNTLFSRAMKAVHARYRERPMTTEQFLSTVRETTGKDARSVILPWLERSDVPGVALETSVDSSAPGFVVSARLRSDGYRVRTAVALELPGRTEWRLITAGDSTARWTLPQRPLGIRLNPAGDLPTARARYQTLNTFLDEYHNLLIVYGTARQDEANRTLAARYQAVIADAFTEILPPLRKDSETTAGERDSADLILFGGPSDNSLTAGMLPALGIEAGHQWFRWRGRLYAAEDDGLMAAFPNPANPARTVYVILANSALQLHSMTKRHQRLPSWALFKGENPVEKGYHDAD